MYIYIYMYVCLYVSCFKAYNLRMLWLIEICPGPNVTRLKCVRD